MSFVSLFFFVAGATLLIFGFKKNNRALLTTAAFLWLASGAWEEFSHGFLDGLARSAPVTASAPIR